MRGWRRIIALAIGMALLLACAGCGKSGDLRFGTGGTGGNYYVYGNALAQILEQENGLSVDVKATAGSAANLRLLKDDFLQLAIVQSDTLMDAQKGTGAFQGEACTNVSALAGLYTEACQIIVAADSDIASVADLYGKRVSVGEQDSGVMRNAEQILLSAGLNTELIKTEYLSFADAAAALKAGKLDAFFCTASAPTTAVAELARQMDVRILSLDESAMESMLKMYQNYVSYTIPAGTYEGQGTDVETLGVKAVLVARNDLSATTAQEILTALFDHADQLQYSTGADVMPDLQFATEQIPVSFHPGAQQYYAAQGIELNGEVAE